MDSILLKTFRWLLVPISMAAIAAGAFLGGRRAVSLADARCLAEHMIGGACVESWHTTIVEFAIYASVIVAALGITLIPAALAPGLKRSTALLGLLLLLAAFGYAYYVTRWPEFLWPMAVAAFTGLFGLAWVHSRSLRHAAAP